MYPAPSQEQEINLYIRKRCVAEPRASEDANRRFVIYDTIEDIRSRIMPSRKKKTKISLWTLSVAVYRLFMTYFWQRTLEDHLKAIKEQ